MTPDVAHASRPPPAPWEPGPKTACSPTESTLPAPMPAAARTQRPPPGNLVAGMHWLAVKAATLSQNTEEPAYMPSIGLAVGAATLVGQFPGDGRAGAAGQADWQCARLGILFMGSMGVLFALVPRAWLLPFAPAPPHQWRRFVACSCWLSLENDGPQYSNGP